tara:strand:+ start:301 stop:516 length:216 start_codon:yes stop_codon:yes gene_type:complete
LEFKVTKGRWDFEFAKTSATITGGGSVSADYEVKCDVEKSSCSLVKFGDYSAKVNASAEACALGYCISHTF